MSATWDLSWGGPSMAARVLSMFLFRPLRPLSLAFSHPKWGSRNESEFIPQKLAHLTKIWQHCQNPHQGPSS